MIKKVLKYLVEPKSKDDDNRRHELILNILLVSTIGLLLIATILKIIFDGFFAPPAPGVLPLANMIYIDLFFILLYFFSRKGYSSYVAYIFVALYFFLATYMAYLWGVEAQPPLIFYILVIVLSGVLISSHFAFFVTLGASVFLYLFYYLHTSGILETDMGWQDPWQWKEVIVVTIIFVIISVVCWLSNRETEKSLKRARRSEADLKAERDLLEIRIKEKTDELKRTQLERMSNLYRFAEFGRLSSGFFHDLLNPLTIVSLNMEKVKDAQIKEIGEAKVYLAKAIAATKRLEDFIITARKQVKSQEKKKVFSATKEIKQVIEMLSYKAKKNKAEIGFEFSDEVELFGDSVKFSQAITNILANAIDAYVDMQADSFNQRRCIKIKSARSENKIILSIEDFGEGIEKKNLELIFEPFFTTKEESGIGIGLSLTKDIIEKDFKGKIEVESERGKGTKFILKFSEDSG